MALIEYNSEETLRREAAADRLRQLADQLSRQNEVSFTRDGLRFSAKVPDQVTLSVEFEVGDDGSEIEIELRW